jgi:hypothetical protein
VKSSLHASEPLPLMSTSGKIRSSVYSLTVISHQPNAFCRYPAAITFKWKPSVSHKSLILFFWRSCAPQNDREMEMYRDDTFILMVMIDPSPYNIPQAPMKHSATRQMQLVEHFLEIDDNETTGSPAEALIMEVR